MSVYWGEWQVGPVFLCMPTETWKMCTLSCVQYCLVEGCILWIIRMSGHVWLRTSAMYSVNARYLYPHFKIHVSAVYLYRYSVCMCCYKLGVSLYLCGC